ncbi:MAG TPA: hypothetical protein ENJ09_05010 [Planctomycetes bacterium]|nr:hypothetical protein [Planctomycetota bacterium]
MLRLLLALSLLLAPGPGAGAPASIRCTPTAVELPGRGLVRAAHPIARALEAAGPGTVIYLDPGTYEPFTIGMGNGAPNDARTHGGTRAAPIIVDGGGVVRIRGKTDAIAIDQRVPNRYITFKDITILAGERSGVIFFRQSSGRVHEGYAFEDCDILGGFNHATGRGRRSKWGLSGHSVSNLRFLGTVEPARVEGIEKEHAFYIQNPRGAVLLQNIRATGLGRTFCQFTARSKEGPPGRGQITIRDCDVSDCGLAAGDDHKGGSAFTFAGGLEGVILLENNVYHAGSRKDLLHLTRRGEPYGTGALVAWAEERGRENGVLVLRDNRFYFAPGCGDRPVVSIGGCRKVRIVGENVFRAGNRWPALALDPVRDNGTLVSSPNGAVELDARTELQGSPNEQRKALLTVRGKPMRPEEFRAKQARRKEGRESPGND